MRSAYAFAQLPVSHHYRRILPVWLTTFVSQMVYYNVEGDVFFSCWSSRSVHGQRSV